MFGFNGKVLRVDLTSMKWKAEDLRTDWVEKYIGGRGLGIRYLYEELPPKIDALSPENKIIIATGPLTGTIAPLSGRYPLITKSPLTGTILDSYCGSHFGVKMKFAGWDLMIIQGRAQQPTWLYITDKGVEFKDGTKYWGMFTHDVTVAIREELRDEDASVLAIGPAGEKLARIAAVVGDGDWLHGRGGAGAVMGSKNLKAIAIEGYKGTINLYDPDKFKQNVTELITKSVKTDANMWAATDGTPVIVDIANMSGVLVTKDYTQGVFEYAENINTERVKERLAKRYACYSCPLVCKRKIKVNDKILKAPEYETLALVGSNTGIGNLTGIAEINHLADKYGLDTISLGSILGFTIRLYKEGILTKDKIGGLELDWGNTDALMKLTEMIGKREGIGRVLSEGVKRAAETIGNGAEKFAMEVKGLELPGYEARGSWGMALAYATADRGGCHLRAWMVAEDAFVKKDQFSFNGKPEGVKRLQDLNSIKWSATICDFWALDYKELVELFNPALGKNYTEEDLKLIGERIWNLSKMFNVREGFSRKDDYLPARIFTEPLKGGVSDGKFVIKEEFEKALTKYYILRGWNPETSIPLPETLERLGLKEDLKI